MEEVFFGLGAGDVEFFVADEEVMGSHPVGVGGVFYFGDLFLEKRRKWKGGSHHLRCLAVVSGAETSLVDLAVVGQEAVIGVLVLDPEADEEGDGHADGEADNVEGAVGLVTGEVAPGGEEVVAEHVVTALVAIEGAKGVPDF